MYDIITRKGFNHIILAAVTGFVLKMTVIGTISASITFPVMFGSALVLSAMLLTPVSDTVMKWLGTAATSVGMALTLSAADANPSTWFTAFTLCGTLATACVGSVALMNGEGANCRTVLVRAR